MKSGRKDLIGQRIAAGGRIVRVHGDAGCPAARADPSAGGETVETLMTRDLVAWKAAKAAIARAKGGVD